MISNRNWQYLGIIVTAVSGLILLGVTNGFGINITTNLFNTGLTANMLLGIAQIGIAIAIYNNYI